MKVDFMPLRIDTNGQFRKMDRPPRGPLVCLTFCVETASERQVPGQALPGKCR